MIEMTQKTITRLTTQKTITTLTTNDNENDDRDEYSKAYNTGQRRRRCPTGNSVKLVRGKLQAEKLFNGFVKRDFDYFFAQNGLPSFLTDFPVNGDAQLRRRRGGGGGGEEEEEKKRK